MARGTVRILILTLAGTIGCAVPANAQNRAFAVADRTAGAPLQAASAPSADISGIETESIAGLQGLVRINTTNPPGNELAAAKYISSILDPGGILSEIFESPPGRGFLVARLSANAMPDPARALLLMGHLDVVGADNTKWTVDPFGGVIQGGYLYGRGAID